MDLGGGLFKKKKYELAFVTIILGLNLELSLTI